MTSAAASPLSQKNDLRAWLAGLDGNTPHTFADLLTLADTFEPIEPGDKTQQLSQHEMILKNLKLMVIGEYEGSQRIEVFAEETKKSATITDLDKLSYVKLIQLLGPDAVEEYVHDGQEPQPPKVQMKQVRQAIASVAADKVFHGDELYGSGVWSVGKATVLVQAGEAMIVYPGRAPELTHVPFYDGRMLDLSRQSGKWFDFGEISRYLTEAKNPRFGQQAYEEMRELLTKWYWRVPAAPRVVASLVLATLVQTTWSWRPLVALTGPSDCGKSWVLDELLHKGVLGPMMSSYYQKPTEAAVRQHIRHHARAVFLDEFEADSHRQRVLELLRSSSHGGEVIRGTSDQRGTKFRLRHIPWVSAVELGLRAQADRNRFIILDIENIPEEKRGAINFPQQGLMRKLGQRLLATAITHYRAAGEMADKLKALQFPGVPGRVVESFSVPMAMEAVIHGHPFDVAAGLMGKALSHWDFSSQTSRDEASVLEAILLAQVYCEGGRAYTVTQLLKGITGIDTIDVLNRVGINRIKKRNGKRVLFLAHNKIRTDLLKVGSDYFGQSIDQYLLRLPGAKTNKQRLGGDHSIPGVEIPEEEIAKLFEAGADTSDSPNTKDNGEKNEIEFD